jgi:hypothetical protein
VIFFLKVTQWYEKPGIIHLGETQDVDSTPTLVFGDEAVDNSREQSVVTDLSARIDLGILLLEKLGGTAELPQKIRRSLESTVAFDRSRNLEQIPMSRCYVFADIDTVQIGLRHRIGFDLVPHGTSVENHV